jgi:NAD(P)-dependent dehydrogenase (short-subunit alcohol dehydrogenase family)
MARYDVDGRVVLITGGARGIGLATAAAARRRGAIAALIDLDGEAAARRADELGGGSLGLAADVCELEELEAAVAQVVERLGGIDVLVANAGIAPAPATVVSGDRAEQRRVLDINLHGVWHTMWAAAEHVVARRGHIVAISSIAAYVPTPSMASYAASKAAVEQLARSMRAELAPTGTTVGVAHFGVVDTDLVRAFAADPITSALERLGTGIVSQRVTAESAGEALVRDIVRRRPRTIHPSRWSPVFALRGIAGPLADAFLSRDPRARALMTQTRDRDLARSKEPV